MTEGDRVVDVAVALPFFGDLAVGFFVVRDVEVVVDVVYRLLLRSFCHRRRGCSLPCWSWSSFQWVRICLDWEYGERVVRYP